MQQETGNARNPSSQILPLVVSAFAGATLAIACERPDSRVAVPNATPERVTVQQAPANARPEMPAEQRAPASTPSSDALTDTMISGRIKAAILTDPAMTGADISVNTDHGVVSLTGTVKSHEQTGVASAHAQRQDGVMRVDSHLSLNPQ
jgi:hyperosmotically inducible periplasmic protein